MTERGTNSSGNVAKKRLAECVVGRGLGGVWILRGIFPCGTSINYNDNLLTYPPSKIFPCPQKRDHFERTILSSSF